ncbi:hypothetical protein ACWGLJ_33455, partial [Streptomyces sp. NPDC055898]
MAWYAEMRCRHTKAQTVDSPAIAKAHGHVTNSPAATLDSTLDPRRSTLDARPSTLDPRRTGCGPVAAG